MFKNAIAFSIEPTYRLDPELLQRRPARECGPSEAGTDGFSAPCQHASSGLVHTVAGYDLICWQTEDKILPGSVVEEMVSDRCEEIERREGRKPGRKELREMKERVTEELLPRAFSQKRRTLAMIGGGYLIVDTSSQARAERMLESLRRAVDNFPAKTLRVQKMPALSMATWVAEHELPEMLTLDDTCVLEGSQEEKPQVRYARTDINANDVAGRIAQGYMPKKLGMTFYDRVSFCLSADLQITRIAMLDMEAISEKRAEAQDIAETFDIDIAIASGELKLLLDYLVGEFGGQQAGEDDLLTGAKEAAAALDKSLKQDGVTATLSGPDGKVIAKFGAPDKVAELNDRLSELAPEVAYDEAKRVVIENQRASISLVQRHLRIGYNHAARLIEQLERHGIVSAEDRNGKRIVLRKAA